MDTRASATRATTTAPTSPPMAPSDVLPGLIDGANFLRPRTLPTISAPVSEANVTANKKINQSRPASKPRSMGPCSSVPPTKPATANVDKILRSKVASGAAAKIQANEATATTVAAMPNTVD